MRCGVTSLRERLLSRSVIDCFACRTESSLVFLINTLCKLLIFMLQNDFSSEGGTRHVCGPGIRTLCVFPSSKLFRATSLGLPCGSMCHLFSLLKCHKLSLGRLESLWSASKVLIVQNTMKNKIRLLEDQRQDCCNVTSVYMYVPRCRPIVCI